MITKLLAEFDVTPCTGHLSSTTLLLQLGLLRFGSAGLVGVCSCLQQAARHLLALLSDSLSWPCLCQLGDFSHCGVFPLITYLNQQRFTMVHFTFTYVVGWQLLFGVWDPLHTHTHTQTYQILDMIAMIGTSDRLCWLAETCKILLLLTLAQSMRFCLQPEMPTAALVWSCKTSIP